MGAPSALVTVCRTAMPNPSVAFAPNAPNRNMRATRNGACASLRIFVVLLNVSLGKGGLSSPATRTTAARDRESESRGVEARRDAPFRECAARDERGAARATRRGAGATRARGATVADVDIVANMLSRRSFARGEVDEVDVGRREHREPRGRPQCALCVARRRSRPGHHRRFKQGRLKPKLGSSPVD